MVSSLSAFKFDGPAGSLEALWKSPEGEPKGAAVFAHAHPLQGGTMHFKVVFRAARALARAGYGVLRFNFRGVGASQGEYDDGRGEKDDLRVAMDEARRRGGTPLIVGGFSFGSAMALAVGAHEPQVIALIGAGVPTRRWDFQGVGVSDKDALLISGGEDIYGDSSDIRRGAREHFPRARIEIVPSADHFFTDHLDEFESGVAGFVRSLNPAAAR